MPVPHYGMALGVQQFQQLAERCRQQGVAFVIEPHLRFQGGRCCCCCLHCCWRCCVMVLVLPVMVLLAALPLLLALLLPLCSKAAACSAAVAWVHWCRAGNRCAAVLACPGFACSGSALLALLLRYELQT